MDKYAKLFSRSVPAALKSKEQEFTDILRATIDYESYADDDEF
jgi:hypothetical protein